MIISASRRTDIPAFYADWFMRRVRAGFCRVTNPFNPAQSTRVSLLPEDVEAIVFWTRYPRPLFPFLNELEARGLRFYFQYTLLDHPRLLEPRRPDTAATLETFMDLAARLGPGRVVWRYDPIVFTSLTPPEYHLETYTRLAQALAGSTRRSVISLMDPYAKIRRRMEAAAHQGAQPLAPGPEAVGRLLCGMAAAAAQSGMEITSCAEEPGLEACGIRPGKCIDDALLQRLFGLAPDPHKDPGQRAACGCVMSKDIGAYDTCGFGCVYCYATSGSFDRARARRAAQNPAAEALGE